ncbi:beta-ketoacyl-[acyl-carrier-protein] synthase family protein [Halalkalibacter alkalisediminis]|uniref:Beta-ketoacyl synthase N-terminal-like domain-containing protein n=1 Tax=Halalkalibacter alkalisediminis TaxID=935616 RepID=A0ABV6NP95_9BACI|nr:beta-ketoacyl-[acyl-carrier-protein] synthase family protein [Halalkalibacter alkalisediminis]
MTSLQIAVTGIGILSSIGRNKQEVYESMEQNKSGIDRIKSFDPEPFISKIGAELKMFDSNDYFTLEKEKSFDRCSQYAIVSIQEALEEAHVDLVSSTIGLAFGTCNGGLNSLEQQRSLEELDPDKTRNYPFYQQGDTVASHFQLSGPVMTLNTACAASGNAIGYACDMLRHGHADIMIAGGSDSMSTSVYAGFNSLKALNDAPCSPYNEQYGLSLGEGAAFVVLEPLEKALAREAKIYTIIEGYGLSSDAYHETAPQPDGHGIRKAVEMAVSQGNVSKEDIQYINTHGTGTKANDPAELRGLRSYFEDQFDNIYVSSSKAYFGHNLGAAASIEYVTTLLAVEQGKLPATLHFSEAREGCDHPKLVTNTMHRYSPKYFLCNNSAFGGHNSSILSKNVFHPLYSSPKNNTNRQTKDRSIAICGYGTIHALASEEGSLLTNLQQNETSTLQLDFSLKNYNKTLYERRMNPLTQYSIGACDLALKKAAIDESEYETLGLVYGTSRGSLKSAEKYLGSILDRGVANASSVYFPDMVLNSTAGKLAKKFSIKGFSSSHSSGGVDGLQAIHYGTTSILDGKQTTVLVGAGDEQSTLSTEIDKAMNLTSSSYNITEGSTFLMLADYETVKEKGLQQLASIKGFGQAFHSNTDLYVTVEKAVVQCLENANLSEDNIDFIFYHNNDVTDTEAFLKLKEKYGHLPVNTLNHLCGYMESNGSLFHTQVAIELLSLSKEDQQSITQSLGWTKEQLETGLIVSTSINGNSMAMVIEK